MKKKATEQEIKDREKYAARLKEARKSRGLTQVQLAEACGISQSSINAIESSRQTNSIHNSIIASELNVNPIWLAYGQGDMDDVNTSELNTFLTECYILVIKKTKEYDPSMREITTIVEAIYNEGKTTRSVNAGLLNPMIKMLKN